MTALWADLQEAWCRLAHLGLWIVTVRPESVTGRYVWARCARCQRRHCIRIAITPPAPVGKTPR